MAMTARYRAWLLPIVFLLGYLFAWGMILVDRQMLVEEQRQLQDEINQARIELKITKIIDEYVDDYEEMVIWSEEAVELPEEVGK